MKQIHCSIYKDRNRSMYFKQKKVYEKIFNINKCVNQDFTL